MTVATLRIEELKLDGGTQTRAEINRETVNDYAEAMQGGAEFPPITVFYDGMNYWLADGFHRVQAMQRIGREVTGADVRQGSQRDAVLFSVGANAVHGLRRSNEDKRRAVLRLLEDAEWSQWSDREIARRTHVHHQMVGRLRAEHYPSLDDSSSERTYTTKHGTIATMQTANIGSKPAPAPPELSRQARSEGAQVISADELMRRAQAAFLQDAEDELPPHDSETGEIALSAEEQRQIDLLAEQQAALREAQEREIGEHVYQPMPAEDKLKLSRLDELNKTLQQVNRLCKELDYDDFRRGLIGTGTYQMALLALRSLTELTTPPAQEQPRDDKTLDMEAI